MSYSTCIVILRICLEVALQRVGLNIFENMHKKNTIGIRMVCVHDTDSGISET